MCTKTKWYCGCCSADLSPHYQQNVKICKLNCRTFTVTNIQNVFDDCQNCIDKKCFRRYTKNNCRKFCNPNRIPTTSIEYRGSCPCRVRYCTSLPAKVGQ